MLDRLSRQHHGYGWDDEPLQDLPLFPELERTGRISPFLCSNCSRHNNPRPALSAAEETRMLQQGLF